MPPSLTEADYATAAGRLRCSVAAIKAVAKVESRGSGFLTTGEPRILFERHVFRRLTGGKFNKTHPDLSGPYRPGSYGPESAQHGRLAAAVMLDREAALQSASWGKFQIMGENWRMVGRASIQDFVNAQYRSEGEHLKDFCGFVIKAGLQDELQRLDWAGFARGYNGPAYATNRYDEKMAKAYAHFQGAA